MKSQKQLIVILGPTASGKSELAVFLAKQITKHKLGGYKGAEIISADSRQVYKYLDIGTNKVPGKWQNSGSGTSGIFLYKKIQHHCIDLVHPRKMYTIAEYQTCAQKAIAEITGRGYIPILTGGTGFYIQAVVDGLLLPKVPPNKKLRALLEKKSTQELFDMLQKLDPERASNIDSKNPRRLMRAIEICKATKNQIPKLHSKNEFQTLFIGIKKETKELQDALEKRSKQQIPGLLKEVKLLLHMKVPKKRIRELGFEYSTALKYLETGHPNVLGCPVSKYQAELAENIAKENWRYAKRQITWFKRDKRIEWIKSENEAFLLVKKFLRN